MKKTLIIAFTAILPALATAQYLPDSNQNNNRNSNRNNNQISNQIGNQKSNRKEEKNEVKGDNLSAQWDYFESAQYYEKAAAKNPTQDIYYKLGLCYQKMDRYSQALAAYNN